MGLDLVEFVMAVEEHFGIEIPDEEASELSTPRKVMDYVERHLSGRPVVVVTSDRYPSRSDPRNWTRQQIEEAVRNLVREQLGISQFGDDDHFVHDLQVD